MNLPWKGIIFISFCQAIFKAFTYETRRVVVLDGLGVAEGLEDRVGLEQLLFQLALGNIKVKLERARGNVNSQLGLD